MSKKRKNRKSFRRILSFGFAGALAWGLCVSSYAADMPGGSPGGDSGGSSSGFTLSSAKTELESGTYEDVVFEDSTSSDEVAVRAGDDVTADLINVSITKSGGDSSGDDTSFYGVNSGLLVYGTSSAATVSVTDSTVTTSAGGANGIFSYGEGIVSVSDSTVTTASNSSGGIMVAGGGTLYALNLQVTTEGGSSAAVRSDRGSGTMVVDQGIYVSNGSVGTGSPAIYCVADITAANATLVAKNAQAVCFEGRNPAWIYNCWLEGCYQASDDDENSNVMIYQSQSGDSDDGTSSFTMVGGVLKANNTSSSGNAKMFYTTNTYCYINLYDVEMQYADGMETFLLCACNTNSRGWGTAGANGSECVLYCVDQEIAGDIIYDTYSLLYCYFTQGSVAETALVCREDNGSRGASVYMDSTSEWIVTGDSEVVDLYTGGGTIVDADGNTVTVAAEDGTLYVSGTGAYTITVTGTYSEEDLSSYDSVPTIGTEKPDFEYDYEELGIDTSVYTPVSEDDYTYETGKSVSVDELSSVFECDESDGSGSDTDSDGDEDTDSDNNEDTDSNNDEDTDGVDDFDSSAWLYNSSSDVYYQTGVVYCTDPYNTTYESFGIYVPASYMNMTSNGNGTYTFVSFTDTAVGDYTAETAPIVIPVNTAGYAAQAAPTGFSSGVTTYTDEGIIYLYAGCRGRDTTDGGAPWGVTDLKAAIRYYRYNASVLPGDTDSIFSFGHSGGGAQSAVLGASGDSELYYPYLYSIGAAGISYDEDTDTYTSTVSDSTCGAMCWCPITSLDYADAAYEWMMGQYSSSGTRADSTWTSLLSDDLSEAFAKYINSLTLEDEDGNVLTLTDEGDGIWTSGTYYEYLLSQIEYSLNDFIDSYTDEDGNFSYSSSGSGSSSGGPGSGSMPDFGGFTSLATNQLTAESDDDSLTVGTAADSSDALTTYLLTLDENYGTDEAWITYDEDADWYCISSVEDFVLYGSKSASKDVGAFDDLNTTQAENYVFGTGSNGAAHFDSLIAELLSDNYAEYAAADSSVSELDILSYASDYQDDYDNYTTDAVLGYSSQYRQNMYNPMYYLCQDYKGYGTSTAASYWRINTGITQSDTSLTVEMNLYLALMEDIADVDSTVEDVEFATHWAQGHTTAERAGADSDECFIEWISECMAAQADSSDESDGTGDTDDGNTDDGNTDDGNTDDSDTGDADVDSTVTDTLCARRGNTWYFQETIDSEIASWSVSYGKSMDEVLIGDWDGDG
ncbi:MAG: hypothetical protein LUF32_08145, partial [Clostridiales bacterium]|nr:hypothetical protein [Clostridiales bacterium]